jgi:hypothetical protein
MGAPLPPVPNVASVFLRGTTPGEIWENVLYMGYTGPAPSQASVANYAQQVTIVWNANVASLCPSPIVLTSCVVTDIASNTGQQGIFNVTIPGTRGDDVIGSNTAMLVSYPSTMRFRGGHFRQYLLVGGNADNQDGMNWHDAFVGAVNTQWNAFVTGITGITAAGTTYSQHVGVRRHGKFLPNGGAPHFVLNTPIVIPFPANSGVAHKQMASQKGRIGRRSK